MQKILSWRTVALAAMSLAFVIVIASFAGSNLPQSARFQGVSTIEHVMVAKSIGGPVARSVPPVASANARSSVPQIAREGKMTLFASDVESAISRISSIARQQDGDVLALDATSAADSVPGAAHLTIRVPATHFDASMQAVAGIGKVRDRSISANDLSGDISDSSARLKNLRRTESDIRKIMDRSGSVSQVLDAENQLSQVREQIEQLQASLQSMQTRVVYSTIDVDVQSEVAAAPVEPTAASQLITSWHAAAHALGQFTIGILSAVLWIAMFLPYAVLCAAVAWFASVQIRRRRRA